MRLAAMRLLLLASLAVVAMDCLHYFSWPFSLGLIVVLAWPIFCAYLYARDRIDS